VHLNEIIGLLLVASQPAQLPEIDSANQTSFVQKVRYPLNVPNQIADSLSRDGFVVFCGAPASGKSEQLEFVLPHDKTDIFDLSQAFPDAYCAATGRDRAEVQAEYSKGSRELKKAQLEWLREHHAVLAETLKNSSSDVIVFEEIDFTGSYSLSEEEEAALEEIVALGDILKKAGKKVVFVIHSAGNQSVLFWGMMKQKFGTLPQQAVKTAFLTREEEEYLLSTSKLTKEERIEFLKFSKGSPTAYLPFLKKTSLSLSELKEAALKMSGIVIQFTKQCNRSDIWDLLVSVAKGESSLEEIGNPEIIDLMMASSFVGKKEGKLVMTEFAAEALRSAL